MVRHHHGPSYWIVQTSSAAILVLVLNADAIVISKVLWNNADIRGKFISPAIEYHDNYAERTSRTSEIRIQADTVEANESARQSSGSLAEREVHAHAEPSPTSGPRLSKQLRQAGGGDHRYE